MGISKYPLSQLQTRLWLIPQRHVARNTCTFSKPRFSTQTLLNSISVPSLVLDSFFTPFLMPSFADNFRYQFRKTIDFVNDQLRILLLNKSLRKRIILQHSGIVKNTRAYTCTRPFHSSKPLRSLLSTKKAHTGSYEKRKNASLFIVWLFLDSSPLFLCHFFLFVMLPFWPPLPLTAHTERKKHKSKKNRLPRKTAEWQPIANRFSLSAT